MKKLLFLLSAAALMVLAACGGDSESERDSGTNDEAGSNGGDIDTIVFADAGWDSIRVHNSIAQMIIEEGYGFDTDVTAGSTAATIQGLRDGDINAYTEVWTDNIREVHEEAVEAGDYEVVSTNFDDNDQGLYVPTYVIEGDSERDIEPMAPDLRTVEDLKNFPEVFEDPEDPERGRVINAPSGWAVADHIDDKFEVYGLDETLNNFMPGSDAAIVADLASAYEGGEAWVGYYWSPTWVTAEFDLTLLEEDPYDEETWNETRATEFPPNDVVVAVHKDLPDQAPDVVEFLSNYETSTELTEEALVYMDENDASPEEAAIWWMNEHENLWTGWVSEEVAEDVKAAMQ
ncbi:ABC transporter substrate-binding protein [Virgibacillus oceani]